MEESILSTQFLSQILLLHLLGFVYRPRFFGIHQLVESFGYIDRDLYPPWFDVFLVIAALERERMQKGNPVGAQKQPLFSKVVCLHLPGVQVVANEWPAAPPGKMPPYLVVPTGVQSDLDHGQDTVPGVERL
jgi:hypothetical protein